MELYEQSGGLDGRGWDGRSRAKPAAEYEIRYGSGLLRKESAHWQKALVVSTPSAFTTARPYLTHEPAGVAFVQWMDWEYLHEISRQLPQNGDVVIGLGGGRAVDAAKFVALQKGLPLITVPTIVSTGAIIHGVVAKWNGREPSADDWPWVDCEYVLVDDDLVLEAPDHLNTAGLGDILCTYGAQAEWRSRARMGQGPPLDEALMSEAVANHRKIARAFEESLDGGGRMTGASVRHIMKCLQERDGNALRHPGARGGDHHFLIALELVNDRSWVHGEIVALGALILAWMCDAQPDELANRLDRCRVRRRPTEMDLSPDQLLRGLSFVGEYMEKREIDSVLRTQPVTEEQFKALWKYLETS